MTEERILPKRRKATIPAAATPSERTAAALAELATVRDAAALSSCAGSQPLDTRVMRLAGRDEQRVLVHHYRRGA